MKEDEVQEAFLKEIKAQCLSRNFGTLSKSEFDGLVFHYYLQLKNVQLSKMDSQGYVSDYEIGRDLGLTIQRVRSLREKEALRRTDGGEWKEIFLQCIKKATYDEKSDLVKFLIPDVNVLKEVRHLLETMGLYDEYQRNPKLFQCRLDVFISLCLAVQDKVAKTEDAATKLGKDVLNLLRSLPDDKISKAAASSKDKIIGEIKEGLAAVASDLVKQIPVVGGALDELSRVVLSVVKIRKHTKNVAGLRKDVR